jgi:signal transduction histidine kinase
MAHQHPRDLADGTQGRGYAQRVSPALPAWLRKPSPRVVDVAVAGAVALSQVGVAAARGGLAEWDVIFAVAIATPLLVRRRWPFVALTAILAVGLSSPVGGPFELPMLVVLYTIGSVRSWEATTAATAAAVVGAAAIYELAGRPDVGSDVIAFALPCLIVAWLGLYVGSRRTSMEELRALAERLDRERELLAERAVAEERVRIAQELHDVVAHNVSLIVVQAQALGATFPDERVTEATTGIADLGRQAMAEMHRTLKLLRANEDEAAKRGPQPGLGDLEALLERTRAAGVRVELAVEGKPHGLSQSADLSAYRIVQEALTNVVKHADGAATTVTLNYRADGLELTIRNRGGATPNGTAGAEGAGRHGVIGMRERATLFGGTLTAGPRRGGGFEVQGVLPYSGGRSV